MTNNNAYTLLTNIFSNYAKNGDSNLSDDEKFQYFVVENYFKSMNLSLEQIGSGLLDSSQDWGVDGMYTFVDDQLVREVDDDYFTSLEKNFTINTYVFQFKNHNKIDEDVLHKFNTFSTPLFDLESETKQQSMSTDVSDHVHQFHQCIINGISKYPKINVHFVHASLASINNLSNSYTEKRQEISKGMNDKSNISNLKVDFTYVGAEKILKLTQMSAPESGKLKVNSTPINISFGKSNDQQDGYLTTAYLNDFYRFITYTTEESHQYNDLSRVLNENIFESNIRDYQNKTNVNKEIENTLINPQFDNPTIDFWWLNNGITILADEGSIAGKVFSLENVQIVNGLQTANSIFTTFSKLKEDDERSVFIKILISKNDHTRDRIIRATNSQNPVTASQLRSSDPLQRKIEDYLKIYEYFYDRKKNYYRNKNKPISKIISINYLSQALVAILNQDPVKARSNPTVLIKKDSDYDKLFNEGVPLTVYLNAIKIRDKTQAQLKKVKQTSDSKIKNIANNYKLHVTRVVASLLTHSPKINSEMLASLSDSSFKKLDSKLIDHAVNIVYKTIGDRKEDLSKRQNFNTELTTTIISELSDSSDN